MTAARNHFLGLELPRTLQSLAVISSHWQTLANIDLVSRLHVTFKDELINIREQPLHFVDFHGIPNDTRRSIAFCTPSLRPQQLWFLILSLLQCYSRFPV